MALFDWFRRLFKRTADAPPSLPARLPPEGLALPDAPETLIALSAHHADTPGPGLSRPEEARSQPPNFSASEPIDDDLYGICFGIEYIAADGSFSRRRIMVRNVEAMDGVFTYIRAYCFERKALRTFRADRVQCVIDGDGEIHPDISTFFRNELRINIGSPPQRPAPTAPPAEHPVPAASEERLAAKVASLPDRAGLAQRKVARDGLRVLVALGRSDGELHPKELDVILDFIADICRRGGVPCEAEDRAALAPYLRRQRPGADVLEECLDRIEAGDVIHRELLFDYAARVIAADGLEHPEELRLLGEARARAGAPSAA